IGPCLFDNRPRLSLRLLEGKQPLDRLVIDIIGGTDRCLLVIRAGSIVSPAGEPHAAALALAIPDRGISIETSGIFARGQFGPRASRGDRRFCEGLGHVSAYPYSMVVRRGRFQNTSNIRRINARVQ